MERRTELCGGLDSLGISWTDEQIAGLMKYVDELLLWNPTHGLVGGEGGSREAPADLVARHLLDSLAPLGRLTERPVKELADVGSGAGFPGIPLAIFMPEARVTLIEKQGRRCNFLRNVVALLGLKDRVSIEQRDVRKLDKTYDLVTLRAFAALPDFYPTLADLTGPEGRIAAYKGQASRAGEEMAALERVDNPPSRMELVSVKVPSLEAERCLVLIEP